MTSLDILSIGDVSIDQYMTLENAEVVKDTKADLEKICFGYGSKIPVSSFMATIAGNACNTAIAFNKLSLKTAVYTEIGDDPNGNKFVEVFDKVGIESKFCLKDKNYPTNVHTIIIYKGERTIFSFHADREYKIQNWPHPKWIYYTSMPPKFENFQDELIKYVEEHNIALAFNPGTYHLKSGIDNLRNILNITNVLFVNEEEASRLVGSGSIETMHEKLQTLGPQVTVITQGSKGSTASDGSNIEKLGILKGDYKVVDKTGAGDAHSAGFLAAMFYGKALKECLMWGTLNSAYVVQKVGSVHGHLKKDQLEELVKQKPIFI